MGDKSKIEWTDATWNPVTGCTKVSQGCKYCYAERQFPRVYKKDMRQFTDVMCHPERLVHPIRWKNPRKIFVNSMSDLFHEDVPFQFIASVFAIMGVTTRHTYQILTKRPKRMLEFFEWAHEEIPAYVYADEKIFDHFPNDIEWKPLRGNHGGYDNCGPAYPYENVWIGVSVEDQETANERIPLLLQAPAAVRWISAEPLLGPIDLYEAGMKLDGKLNHFTGERAFLKWVVVGGESGPKARPMHPQWVKDIRDQCVTADIPFLFKQWGQWVPVDLTTSNGITDWMIVDKAGDIDIPDNRTPREDLGEIAMWNTSKKKAGRLLDGKLWDQYPT